MQENRKVKTEFENSKLMTEKQRQLINQLLQSNRVEKRYRQFVEKILQNTVSSRSASKLITFLVALIAFKKCFVKFRRNGNGAGKKERIKKVPVDVVSNLIERVISDVGYALRAMDSEVFDSAYECLDELYRELCNSEFVDLNVQG